MVVRIYKKTDVFNNKEVANISASVAHVPLIFKGVISKYFSVLPTKLLTRLSSIKNCEKMSNNHYT